MPWQPRTPAPAVDTAGRRAPAASRHRVPDSGHRAAAPHCHPEAVVGTQLLRQVRGACPGRGSPSPCPRSRRTACEPQPACVVPACSRLTAPNCGVRWVRGLITFARGTWNLLRFGSRIGRARGCWLPERRPDRSKKHPPRPKPAPGGDSVCPKTCGYGVFKVSEYMPAITGRAGPRGGDGWAGRLIPRP